MSNTYEDVILIVEEKNNKEKEKVNRISFQANSVMLSLMFTYFYHMFRFEKHRTADDKQRSERSEYIISIDHVRGYTVSLLSQYLREFDVSSVLCVDAKDSKDEEIPITAGELSFSILVLLDYLGVRENRKVYFERLIRELNKFC